MAAPRPARKVADPTSADTKTRILDAAERCFVRSGFHRTTMQDVAAEASMSPGNLYRYFASKDAIIIGICPVSLKVSGNELHMAEGARP